MTINIPIKVRIEMTKKFEWAYKKSIEVSVKHILKTIKNEMPSDSGRTKKALYSDIDWRKGEARIGWPEGSKEEMIGSVLEYGSGERGKSGGIPYIKSKNNFSLSTSKYSSKFGSQPNYTVPIMPTHSKAMKFKGINGNVFMKEFKGHIPRYVLTRGLIKSMRFLPVVFSNEMNK